MGKRSVFKVKEWLKGLKNRSTFELRLKNECKTFSDVIVLSQKWFEGWFVYYGSAHVAVMCRDGGERQVLITE
jgi:hypothetical protein